MIQRKLYVGPTARMELRTPLCPGRVNRGIEGGGQQPEPFFRNGGASKGIGLAIVQTLQHAGHTVFGTSRKPQNQAEYPFPLLTLDVNNGASVTTAVAQVLEAADHIDVLINNAGYDLYGAAEETTMAEMTAQMDTNLFGAVRMIQAVLPHMRERRRGKIINIGSIGGFVGLPYNGAYAASKFAVEGYSESLRLEVQPFDVYVTIVEPGAVATDTLDTSIVSVQNGHPAYQSARNSMIQQMRTMGSQSPITPQTVAKTVAHIVNLERPKLRYPVGNQAHSVPWLKQLLPQRWFEQFMQRQFVTA